MDNRVPCFIVVFGISLLIHALTSVLVKLYFVEVRTWIRNYNPLQRCNYLSILFTQCTFSIWIHCLAQAIHCWVRHRNTIGFSLTARHISLPWRHNGHDSVSNHQPHDCLLNRLFRRRSKKTSKSRATGFCAEFLAQMTSSAEIVFIWWRHHVLY